jgi:hypothetical protein
MPVEEDAVEAPDGRGSALPLRMGARFAGGVGCRSRMTQSMRRTGGAWRDRCGWEPVSLERWMSVEEDAVEAPDGRGLA